MAFLNYKMTQKYTSEPMKDTIRRLKDYDVYHCLLGGNKERSGAVRMRIPDLPEGFYQWLEVCDGGKLFDITMLTTVSYDPDLDLHFKTYDQFPSDIERLDMKLHDDYFVFGYTVLTDLFFFDSGKKDGRVYQWCSDDKKVYASWDSFEDWLAYQVDDAVLLIADGTLEPMDIKLEAYGNG